jgi:transposase-like protein
VCGPMAHLRESVIEATIQPVVGNAGKRRYRRTEEKRWIVEETLSTDASVVVVARWYGVNANHVFRWRKLHRAGLCLGPCCGEPESGLRLLPVTVSDEAADALRSTLMQARFISSFQAMLS